MFFLAIICVIVSAVIAGLDAKAFIWPSHDWLVAGLVFAFLAWIAATILAVPTTPTTVDKEESPGPRGTGGFGEAG